MHAKKHMLSAPELPRALTLEPVSIERDQMIAFAQRFDAQPFHIDESAAEATLLGGLAASAWHTCAKVLGEFEATINRHGLQLSVAGVEQIVLLGPVRAGDRLVAEASFSGERGCGCGDSAITTRINVSRLGGDTIMRLMLDCARPASPHQAATEPENCALKRGRPARVTRFNAQLDAIRFFDEIQIGDEIPLGRYSFSAQAVAEFIACTTGRFPPSAADESANLPDAVPLWHIPAAWMQRMVCYYDDEAARRRARGEPIPRLGPASGIKQLRWHRPVALGETIVFRGWAERKIEIASQTDWGLLIVGAEGSDVDGNLVVSFYPQMLIERRNRAR